MCGSPFFDVMENCERRVRIVALGDSLTAGLQASFEDRYSLHSTPYTRYLKVQAREYLNVLRSDVNVEIINKGLCGDLTSDMLERFSIDVVKARPGYVIIIGGTNDVGWGLHPRNIFDNLKGMYDMAENNNIQPVACTIPSILGLDELIPPRLDLNNLILREAGERGMGFVDLFKATADPLTNRLMERYSSDGLHLNTDGYQAISEAVFDEWLRLELKRYTKYYGPRSNTSQSHR